MTHSRTRPAAGQVWNPEDYIGKAGFVAELGRGVLDLLAPRPDEHILDLGCGDGALTQRIAAASAVVTGLEPSAELAAVARQRGLRVIEGDAHDPFGQVQYDAIFSNAMFHWLRDPQQVIRNAFAALRPGGRLVVEQGGFGNVAAVTTALRAAMEAAGCADQARNPWDFPSPTTQRKRLETAGFQVEEIILFSRPTPLEAGMRGWLDTFAGAFLQDLPGDVQHVIKTDTERRLTSSLLDPEEGWIADYVRLRFHAVRPADG
ncbi:MAG: Methylase involved in ubiquinone/menaquinone biosynthesis [Rhodobacteraceae bacterium HLUCCA12]|nr:MAG: Methylase involved in ubiquinone/menaquinone biosynthesis [Rhodobacteraceae bacterium HLUCCA12]